MVLQSAEGRVARKLFLTTQSKRTEFVNDLLLKIQKIQVASLAFCCTFFSRRAGGGVIAYLLRITKSLSGLGDLL